MFNGTLQWYEALWLLWMLLATGANGFGLLQAIADRAAARRDAKRRGIPWAVDQNPNRTTAKLAIVNYAAPLVVTVPGVFFGWSLARQPEPPHRPDLRYIWGISQNSFALTIFFLVLAAVLAVWPIWQLANMRRLYAMAGMFEKSPAATVRAERVTDTLRIVGVMLAACVIAYVVSVYQDLAVSSHLDGGVALSGDHLFTQVFRNLIYGAVISLGAGLVLGWIIGKFYILRGPLDRDSGAEEYRDRYPEDDRQAH